ncbi:hypothetical protein TIFTF001_001099 [Ficus carica]|uniref:Germin-like protein n=1 Tax=Ficus carica TaxID=3494 RepID=A0AA88CPH7_FICCA|nr:hypothetical protein TIFTF001_001099 [Ficus carica]
MLGVKVAGCQLGEQGKMTSSWYYNTPTPEAPKSCSLLRGRSTSGSCRQNQDGNRLFTKILHKGYVFVFPIGLIHFQFNVAKYPAVAFAGFGSQNPGTITIANAVFGSNPPINPEVLAKAFILDKDVVEKLQKKSAP